jgi:hypothetical protein
MKVSELQKMNTNYCYIHKITAPKIKGSVVT